MTAPVKGISAAAALALALLTLRATPLAVYRSPAYASALLGGEFQDFAVRYGSLLKDIELSPDSDVVITGRLEQSDLIPKVDLQPDAKYWTNEIYAHYFGKNSVSVVP